VNRGPLWGWTHPAAFPLLPLAWFRRPEFTTPMVIQAFCQVAHPDNAGRETGYGPGPWGQNQDCNDSPARSQ
jgi:hypothetical protein